DGILVADFSRVLAGPLCTQLLGDAGARVIKVEEPGGGDETRRWGPPFVDGVSAYFLSVNRNKESLALNLKTAEGRAVAKKLIDRADVVVDNFLPSQRKALGLEDCGDRVIHCSIGGFDSDSPEAGTPGYDLLAQAGSGLMAITGDPDGEPMKVGVALADVLTAHYATSAICAALFARERTGRGARIEVSLFSAAIASLVNVAQNALVTGKEAKRHGNAHASIVPYQLFHASDRPFAIGAGTDRHFASLCRDVIGHEDLVSDRRFATNAARVKNRAKLVPLLESIFETRRASHWVGRCRNAGVPAAIVQGVREALRSPAGRILVVDVDHPDIGSYPAVLNPLMFSGQRFPVRLPPPSLGQHTKKILRELDVNP
ncbi:MAG: CaiB/BaiF CoA transferase family protein, partial [Thermoanaerobaculia bacterium]